MDLDDELCLCFHVKKRKVVNYLRVNRPQFASQLSECGGAGTGCGWCVPFLKKLHRLANSPPESPSVEPGSTDYATARDAYIRSGKGSPPPA